MIDDLSSSCSGSPKSTVSDRQLTVEDDPLRRTATDEDVFEIAKEGAEGEIEMEDLSQNKKMKKGGGPKIFEFPSENAASANTISARSSKGD